MAKNSLEYFLARKYIASQSYYLAYGYKVPLTRNIMRRELKAFWGREYIEHRNLVDLVCDYVSVITAGMLEYVPSLGVTVVNKAYGEFGA